MGNTNKKSGVAQSNSVNGNYRKREDCFDQTSTNTSQRSCISLTSDHSAFTFCRPNSRLSSKSRSSTRTCDSSKEPWPVSRLVLTFLPVFPIHLESKKNNLVILDEVAKGAFGKVYKVKDPQGDSLYALKVLSKYKIIKENAVQQVKDEVLIQKACGHHTFIVNCPFHWQSKKHLYIVSQFVEGGELHKLLKTYVILPLALIQLYVAQLAIVLDFLHNAGIIYRDLKPENVLLDNEGNLQLTDFGLSKWLSYGSRTKTFCGTLRYVAPEVLYRQPYGHAVDWWSLGIVACVMLTAQYPALEPPEPAEVPQKIKLPADAGMDIPSKDLLLRLLEVDPSRRLKSLRTLLTIAFYKGYNIDDVKNKKISPKEILHRYYPHGPPESSDLEVEDFEMQVDDM